MRVFQHRHASKPPSNFRGVQNSTLPCDCSLLNESATAEIGLDLLAAVFGEFAENLLAAGDDGVR